MKIKKYIAIVATLLVIAVLGLVFIGKNKDSQASKLDSVETKEISLDSNLQITSVSSYKGPYVEDGTDEEVKDILAITVKNNGKETLQYAEATLAFGEEKAEFAFSTIRPGESVVVLEKNRMKYTKEELKSCQINNIIYFAERPDFCKDKLEISALDGAFNVKNISGEDLTGNIAIYYKNKQEDSYLGGITYRAIIEGGIEKDGIRQVMTNHFTLEGSEVMFVGYTEME